jgi:hypothetical protein
LQKQAKNFILSYIQYLYLENARKD